VRAASPLELCWGEGALALSGTDIDMRIAMALQTRTCAVPLKCRLHTLGSARSNFSPHHTLLVRRRCLTHGHWPTIYGRWRR